MCSPNFKLMNLPTIKNLQVIYNGIASKGMKVMKHIPIFISKNTIMKPMTMKSVTVEVINTISKSCINNNINSRDESAYLANAHPDNSEVSLVTLVKINSAHNRS